MKKIILFLSFAIFLVASCKQDKEKQKEVFSIKDFKESKQIKLQKLSELDHYSTPFYLYNNKMLLVDPFPKDYILSIFDSSGNLINRTVSLGKGPNELQSIHIIDLQDSLICLYDGQMLQVLYYYRLSDLLQSKNPVPVKKFDLGPGMTRIKAIINDNRFIVRDSRTSSKIQIMDTTKKILREIGSFDFAVNEQNGLYVHTAYSKNIVVNSKKDKFALIYNNIDLIEIYDTIGNLLLRKHGPDNFTLYKFTPEKPHKGAYTFTVNKSKIAYINSIAKGRYIYALYNGKLKTSDSYYENRLLLVFDWQGNPVKYYQLSEAITEFDIDTFTNTLYAYSNKNFTFYKAKL